MLYLCQQIKQRLIVLKQKALQLDREETHHIQMNKISERLSKKQFSVLLKAK